MLCGKERNTGVMTVEFASILGKVLFQTHFHSAILTVVIVLLNSKDHCSK